MCLSEYCRCRARALTMLVMQIIGVAAAVIGDMSGRPHWGLYELDFVFSTLVVSYLPMHFAEASPFLSTHILD